MNTELANKITSMLQAIPAHAKWDIEIIGIQPVLEGLYIERILFRGLPD